MSQKTERPKMIVSIVERGKGKDIIRLYNKEGVHFHYQTIGRGTATSEIMDILGLDSRDKKHGLKTDAQAIVCSLSVDHFAPI